MCFEELAQNNGELAAKFGMRGFHASGIHITSILDNFLIFFNFRTYFFLDMLKFNNGKNVRIWKKKWEA